MEMQLRKDLVQYIYESFKQRFNENIDNSYLPAFEKHGLVFSRIEKGINSGDLRPVSDCIYLDKIQGYDRANIYGGDKEVSSSMIKKTARFHLLREVTAENVDLWCEYAVATKGLSAFRFSKFLLKTVNDYFEQHSTRVSFR